MCFSCLHACVPLFCLRDLSDGGRRRGWGWGCFPPVNYQRYSYDFLRTSKYWIYRLFTPVLATLFYTLFQILHIIYLLIDLFIYLFIIYYQIFIGLNHGCICQILSGVQCVRGFLNYVRYIIAAVLFTYILSGQSKSDIGRKRKLL